MSAKITLTADDEEHTPFVVETDHLVRYEPRNGGSIVTCMTEGGLLTRVVRETRAEIEDLVRKATLLP